jgi:hypothetical protein
LGAQEYIWAKEGEVNENGRNFIFSAKYYSGNRIKKNEMGRVWGTYGRLGDAYSILVGKPNGRPRHELEDNTRWFKYDRDKL